MTLDDAERWYKIPEARLKRLETLHLSLFNDMSIERRTNLQDTIAKLEHLINFNEPILRIKDVLTYVSWRGRLIKYDLINNQTDVLMHIEQREEQTW